MISEVLGVLRIVFGLIFLLFVPGYALMLAFFPKKEELGIAERIGFACALSIAADLLTTLFIDLVLHIPTTAVNIVAALLTLTGLSLAVWALEVWVMRKMRKRKKNHENFEKSPLLEEDSLKIL